MLKTDNNLHMDKFVVKMPAVSSTKNASSHLLPNLTDLTAHDQAIKYPECTFHVDDVQTDVLLIVQYCEKIQS